MKKAIAVPFLGIPVLLFLLSRMTSFFSEVWGIKLFPALQGIALAAGVILLFVFRKQIYSFLEKSAYGFGGIAVTIYILSTLVCYKYRGVVLNGGARQTVDCIIGGGLLLALFMLFFMKGSDSLLKRIRKPGREGWIFFLAAFVLLNVQAIAYSLFMKKIFVWDNAGYFVSVHKLNDLFPSAEYFKAVYNSVFETDYNYIIALPASIFCKLFGKSRLVFIMSIVNFYLLPLVMLIYGASRRFFKSYACAIAAVVGLPYLIFAANTGFIDVGGIVFAFLAAVIFLWGDGEEMCVLSGVCLALCVLMRRWYSFYAVSFIITSVLWGVSHKKIRGSLYVTASFAFVLLFFAQPFVSGKLMADYSDMYSAYALGMWTDIKIFTRYYGIVLPLCLSVWAVISQIKARLKITPQFFMWLQGVICFFLFTALQTHGQQHLALYAPMFIILILSAIGERPQMARKRPQMVQAVVWALCIMSGVSVLIPREQPRSIGEIKTAAVFPDFSIYPPADENAEGFLEVTEYMDGEIGRKGKTVCFLASSLEMNYDTLRNAEISLSAKKKHNIDRESYYLTIGDVDKRDGLSDSLFLADYILVPSKLQIHLAPEEQRVISVPYRQIIMGEGIGEAYEKQQKKFHLPSGDEIYLYKRIREITPEEIQSLKAEIKKSGN